MHILLTGLNHKSAPIETREKVYFSKEELAKALPEMTEKISDGVILSTCNRTEIYTLSTEPEKSCTEINNFLADYHELNLKQLSPCLYSYKDIEAVRHLFEVTSGLDSMIVGEPQILGQVRTALTLAAEKSTVPNSISRLFHRAIRTGRRVREETELGRNPLSIGQAAVHLIQKFVSNLKDHQVLLLGAGETGQLVATALHTTGTKNLTIANRTEKFAKELARSLNGTSIPYENVAETLKTVDIVIVATEAPKFLLTEREISAAIEGRHGRSIFLFDLSTPRNIDPTVSLLDNVRLFNLDDISEITKENLKLRNAATQEATTIIDQEVDNFMAWWISLEAIPLIKELRDKAEHIRISEMTRFLGKMPSMSDEDIKLLEAMTKSIINKLLHDPTIALKQKTDPE